MPPKLEPADLLEEVVDEINDLYGDISETHGIGTTAQNDSSQIPVYKARLSRLDSTFQLFNQKVLEAKRLGKQIQGGEFDASKFDKMRISTRMKYYEALSFLPGLEVEPRGIEEDFGPGNDHNVRLPIIPLKTFDGTISEWASFKDNFLALVGNSKLTGAQKLHYLKSSLKGRALQIISTIQTTDLGYKQAWESLIKRFDNKAIQADNHLRKIFNYKPMQKQSLNSLENFLSVVMDNAISFRKLDLTDPSGFILLSLALNSLDSKTREKFEDDYFSKSREPSFDELEDFLQNLCIRLQSSTQTVSSQSTAVVPTPARSFPSGRKVLMTTNIALSSTVCFICKENHRVYECPRFRKWSPKERFNQVKQLHHCINCLSSGHSLSKCPSNNVCKICQKQHHSLLHFSSEKSSSPRGGRSEVRPQRSPATPKQSSALASSSANTTSSEAKNSIICSAVRDRTHVLLGTARARIRDYMGVYHEIRLIIDSGSQRSFITKDFAKKLKLPLSRNPHRLCGLADTTIPGGTSQVVCILCPKQGEQPQLETTAVVINEISDNVPRHPLPRDIHTWFSKYDLADPSYMIPHSVDFLLGADLFGRIFNGSIISSPTGMPNGLETIFGLVLLGPVEANMSTTSDTILMSQTEETLPHNSLDQLLQRFWEIEEVSETPRRHPLDLKCEQHFCHSFSRDESGRYVVRLPFQEDPVNLGPSRHLAAYRFQRLEAKWDKIPTLKGEYNKILLGYLNDAFIVRTRIPGKYFMPHHGVFKNSIPPKLRIVFDASTTTSQGSLNDKLLAGPKLQSDIRHILLNFRQFPIVLVADIEQMYLQIVVHPEDRPFLHFLFRSESAHALEEFEFNRLPFGLSSSPFLAMRVIQQLIVDYGNQYPFASKALQNHRYIDDILTGADSLSEASQLQQELIKLLSLGRFTLKKWASNMPELLENVPHENAQNPVSLSDMEEPFIKLLGMQWDPRQDVLSYHVNIESKISYTKRGVMSVIAKIYDPLGYLTPTVFQAKVLLQLLWKQKLGWDTTLPPELLTAWEAFMTELPLLRGIQIPRSLYSPEQSHISIIGFADASSSGYAAAVFLRVEDLQGQVNVKLILAKSRVAPIKTITIPRLELCAAVLLVRAIKFLVPLFSTIPSESITLLTDSSIVLSWLRIEPCNLKTFVANRIALIQAESDLTQWFHVPSGHNIADIASRGLTPSQLLSNKDWFVGPEWLRRPRPDWPISSKFNLPLSQALPECKTTTLATMQVDTPLMVVLSERFSSYSKVVRVVVYICRFLFNARAPPGERRTGGISLKEMRDAATHLLRGTQQHFFRKEFPLEKSRALAGLSPFLDSHRLMRVGGRLQHSPLNYEAKHPVILPSDAPLSKLVVSHFHVVYLHAGPHLLHSLLRQRFWIISARRVIKSQLRKCLTCNRYQTKNFSPLMGNLPESRFEQGRAFLNTGIDFAGPFLIKDSSRRKYNCIKAYICLFICLSTKAVHLEVVSNLSTEAFMAALERFVARRGYPSKIFTDNGRNFLGASRYLSDLVDWWRSQETHDQINSYLVSREISWHFIPPLAPHFGGLWEAGVKSLKYHLDRVVAAQPFTFEELTTVVTTIEAILNSRPLYQLSSDPDDFSVLTPGHFLVGAPLLSVPEYDYTDTPTNRLSRWQFLHQCVQHIWKRWRLDYLHELQQRGKWTGVSPSVQPGTLVLLREPGVRPLEWPIGRITSVHHGPDGEARVVKIKTAKGEYSRAVRNLAPLPALEAP